MSDFSFEAAKIVEAVQYAADAMSRPHVLMRPTLSRDGNKWCALLGENLQEGVVGFGDTPAQAMDAFDSAWHTARAIPLGGPLDGK